MNLMHAVGEGLTTKEAGEHPPLGPIERPDQGRPRIEGANPEAHLREGLSDEEKARLKEETGWSDEVLDAIGSKEEADIYKNAGLKDVEIGDKHVLIREDIDLDQKDAFGKTNAERMADGKPPLDKDGNPIELHHIGQHEDSPLAELTRGEHRGKGNDAILHDKTKESEINRTAFDGERSKHWQARAA